MLVWGKMVKSDGWHLTAGVTWSIDNGILADRETDEDAIRSKRREYMVKSNHVPGS